MPEMTIPFDTIQMAVDEITASLKRLDGHLGDIDTQLTNTLGGSWTGMGSDSHTATQQHWIGAVQDAYDLLFGLRNSLETAHNNYLLTEMSIRARFGG